MYYFQRTAESPNTLFTIMCIILLSTPEVITLPQSAHHVLDSKLFSGIFQEKSDEKEERAVTVCKLLLCASEVQLSRTNAPQFNRKTIFSVPQYSSHISYV